MMNVLILSCNTGEGHNYAGKALKECILSHGDNAELVDIMLLAGKRISRLVGGSYIGIVTHAPRLFQLLYKAGTLVSSKKRKSPVYYANTLLAERLKKYLDSHPCDVIVTVHLFAAETLTYMKQKGMLKQKDVYKRQHHTYHESYGGIYKSLPCILRCNKIWQNSPGIFPSNTRCIPGILPRSRDV